MDKFTLEQINQFLLNKQHLSDDSRTDDIVRIAVDISGLHGTGIQEPYIALFARTNSFTREELGNALYVERTLVKIRCMRGTLYILPKRLVPIAFAATKPVFDKLSVRFMESRGIKKEDYANVSKQVMDVLHGKAMTVAQIKRELGTALNLSALINLMCDRGLLVRIQTAKDWTARNYSYALFSEYFPGVELGSYSDTEAMALLVKQYLTSFGPVTVDDIAWWIGTSKAKVGQALEQLAAEVTTIQINSVEGEFLLLRTDLIRIKNLKPQTNPIINLLPVLDPYLMGYKKRERYLELEHFYEIFDRSGNVTSTLLVNGRVKGVWDFSRGGVPVMEIHFFDDVESDVLRLIKDKARALGEFLSGGSVSVKIVSSMVSLKDRTAGGFMSPLREKGNVGN